MQYLGCMQEMIYVSDGLYYDYVHVGKRSNHIFYSYQIITRLVYIYIYIYEARLYRNYKY